jgi:serine/threonine protein kinase
VHYDIKPANILLTADYTPKVADFGLARLGERENTHMSLTGGGRGTPGYAAPELWMALPASEKCDVYSFGMVLFEILGRRRNFDPCRGESKEWFPRWVWEKYEQAEIEYVVSCDGIGEADMEKAEIMCKVALWCVQFQPAARPTMSSVVRMLEGEMTIVPPANPFHYVMDSSSGLTSSGLYQSASRETTGRDSELSVSPVFKST